MRAGGSSSFQLLPCIELGSWLHLGILLFKGPCNKTFDLHLFSRSINQTSDYLQPGAVRLLHFPLIVGLGWGQVCKNPSKWVEINCLSCPVLGIANAWAAQKAFGSALPKACQKEQPVLPHEHKYSHNQLTFSPLSLLSPFSPLRPGKPCHHNF